MRKVLRYAWAAPNSVLGLALAACALPGGRLTVVGGVVEAHGPILRWALSNLFPLRGGVAAITLGHVVLARDAHTLDSTRAHERVHVRQYEQWGPIFVPAYFTAGLCAVTRGGHVYHDNGFEQEAVAESLV